MLKKLVKIIRNMFTEDNLATAQIAQLFGSELLKVQQNATTDSGSQPDIVKINPKQFLINSQQYQSNKKVEEQRLTRMLQREAEAAYPLPDSPATPLLPIDPVPVIPITNQPLAVPVKQSTASLVTNSTNNDVWERISHSLERIANKLESVDIAVKKKRVKRITK